MLFTEDDIRPTIIHTDKEDIIYKSHYDLASISFGKDSTVMVDFSDEPLKDCFCKI